MKSEEDRKNDLIVKAAVSVLLLATIVGTPLLYNQGKLGQRTYEQNLRLERKIDSLRFKDDLIFRKFKVDSIHNVRVERKVDSLKSKSLKK